MFVKYGTLHGLVLFPSFCHLLCFFVWKSSNINVKRRLKSLEVAQMFTPIETTIGAVLLHQATSNLLFYNGNVLGLSGFLRRLMTAPTVEMLAFFTGMAVTSLLLSSLVPELVTRYPPMSITVQTVLFTTSVAALIGWGTKVRNPFYSIN